MLQYKKYVWGDTYRSVAKHSTLRLYEYASVV